MGSRSPNYPQTTRIYRHFPGRPWERLISETYAAAASKKGTIRLHNLSRR